MSNMFKYVKASSKYMMEGVKNLVVGHRKLPVTRTVDCLAELKQSPGKWRSEGGRGVVEGRGWWRGGRVVVEGW